MAQRDVDLEAQQLQEQETQDLEALLETWDRRAQGQGALEQEAQECSDNSGTECSDKSGSECNRVISHRKLGNSELGHRNLGNSGLGHRNLGKKELGRRDFRNRGQHRR